MIEKIGLGGSCHWCTEAIFQSLKGVKKVHQGWIASTDPHRDFSEAVLVEFDPTEISLHALVAIHLSTHSCTSEHTMRKKYRSALYYFTDRQAKELASILTQLQRDYADPIITLLLSFKIFRENSSEYLDYYYNDPSKPFCENFINPKLKQLLINYADYMNVEKLHESGFAVV